MSTTTTTPYGVIVTETADSISFRLPTSRRPLRPLPSWLTDDERALISAALDEWWSTAVDSSGARPSWRVQR